MDTGCCCISEEEEAVSIIRIADSGFVAAGELPFRLLVNERRNFEPFLLTEGDLGSFGDMESFFVIVCCR